MGSLRTALASGQTVFGTWLSLTDSVGAELLGQAGFDYLILDCQHGGPAAGDLSRLLQAVELGGTRAFVRVPWPDPAQIMRALDLGAIGVVVPMVSSAEVAEQVGRATKFPPLGERSYGPVRRNADDWSQGLAQGLCLAMIETRAGLEQLDAIAAAPGVDGLFLGPMDLALDLGYPPSLELPEEVLAAIARLVECCKRHGKFAGCAGYNPQSVEQLVGLGVQVLTVGSDMGFLRRGAQAAVEQMRALKGANG